MAMSSCVRNDIILAKQQRLTRNNIHRRKCAVEAADAVAAAAAVVVVVVVVVVAVFVFVG